MHFIEREKQQTKELEKKESTEFFQSFTKVAQIKLKIKAKFYTNFIKLPCEKGKDAKYNIKITDIAKKSRKFIYKTYFQTNAQKWLKTRLLVIVKIASKNLFNKLKHIEPKQLQTSITLKPISKLSQTILKLTLRFKIQVNGKAYSSKKPTFSKT